MLSKNSLTRLAFLVSNTDVEFQSMITLTYGETFPQDGKIVKKHLHHFLVSAARKFGEFDYVWFLEFQVRTAPHIHLLVSLPEPDLIDRVEFALLWVNVVNPPTRAEKEKMFLVHTHRRPKHKAWEQLREKEGAKRYCLKYCLKMHQKVVPPQFADVGRFWGSSKSVRADFVRSEEMTEDQFRQALSEMDNPIAKWDIIPRVVFDRT